MCVVTETFLSNLLKRIELSFCQQTNTHYERAGDNKNSDLSFVNGQMQVKNVLYIPDFHKNLLSEDMVTNNCMKFLEVTYLTEKYYCMCSEAINRFSNIKCKYCLLIVGV